MSYEDHVIELLARADPARDEVSYQHMEGAKYLQAVQMKSPEVLETNDPSPLEADDPMSWRWLAAAAILAVLATVSILIATMEETPPVATTPEIEEPEPVPTSAPESIEEPMPSTPTTTREPTPSTEADTEAIGVSGLPVFEGQPPAGDYEAIGANLRLVFTSDGDWKDCIRPYCDVHGGVEIQPSGLLSVYGWIQASPSPAGLHSSFSNTPDLLVSEMVPFAPSHPDADWTGNRFTVDLDPSAGRHPACQVEFLSEEFPCVEVPFLSPFFVNDELQLVPINLFIHGPTEVMVLTKPDGTSYWAAPIWYPYPQAPEGEYEAINQAFSELVQTIRFVD